MGFLLDIAEIAGLLLAAYVVGWLIGYAARRITAGVRKPIEAPAESLVAAQGATPADALVRAPVVVPVSSASPPPHVVATATQIEPMKAVALPGGAVPAEARPVALPEAPPPPPRQISALETLKALSTAMPLVRVEATANETIVEPVPEPQSAGLESALGPAEPEPRPEPVEVAPAPQPTELEPATSPAEIAPGSYVPVAATDMPLAPAAAAFEAASEPAAAPLEIASAGEPVLEPASVALPPAPPMPASAPGLPWAGAIKGHDAQKFVPIAEPAAPPTEAPAIPTALVAAEPIEVDEPVAPVAIAEATATPIAALAEENAAGLDVELLATIAEELKTGQAPAEAAAPLAESIPVQPPAPPAAATAPIAGSSMPVAEVPPAAAPEQAVTQPTPEPQPAVEPPAAQPAPIRVTFDEDAAMRAIEGGWSRRAARALPGTPEMTDVSNAVSAAQVAVEQVLARNGVNANEPETRAQAAFGKPAGLPHPRDGGRDNLKRIDGLGPLDESTLNNLGIYHFDQIARWDQREVLWLENHAFAVGRIGRENWQGQARELAADRDATRAQR